MKQAIWMIPLIGSFALSACGGDMGDSTILRDDATNTCFTDKITPAIIETQSNIAKSQMARLKPTNAP